MNIAEKVWEKAARSFAVFDIGLNLVKWQNNQISGFHAGVNVAFDLIGIVCPAVGLGWAAIDYGLEVFHVKSIFGLIKW